MTTQEELEEDRRLRRVHKADCGNNPGNHVPRSMHTPCRCEADEMFGTLKYQTAKQKRAQAFVLAMNQS